jgi:hypothetical protein
MGTMTVIQPDGSSVIREHASRPTLDQLQAAVGGLIQPISRFCEPGVEAYANEEGLLRRMAVNPAASEAVRWPVGERDPLSGFVVMPLVGPVVILTGFAPG